MSKRRNGTNRAGALTGGSRWTGFARPVKRDFNLEEYNRKVKDKCRVVCSERG